MNLLTIRPVTNENSTLANIRRTLTSFEFGGLHQIDSAVESHSCAKNAQEWGTRPHRILEASAVAQVGAGVRAKLRSQTFVALRHTIQHSTCESANWGPHVPSLVLFGSYDVDSYNCDLSGVIG